MYSTRKFLALLMAALMALGALPFAAFARSVVDAGEPV